MSNRDKLKTLLIEMFLLSEDEFRFDLEQPEVATWDSLATVSLAVGINETFGYHFTATEAMSVKSFQDIISILESKGISFSS